MKLELKISELTHDDIVSILSGVMSYSSYWCSSIDADQEKYEASKQELKDKGTDVCFEDILANLLITEKATLDFSIHDEDKVHHLTLEKLKKGIEISIEKNNNYVSPDLDSWDAVSCDIVIQNALFGEVVYG